MRQIIGGRISREATSIPVGSSMPVGSSIPVGWLAALLIGLTPFWAGSIEGAAAVEAVSGRSVAVAAAEVAETSSSDLSLAQVQQIEKTLQDAIEKAVSATVGLRSISRRGNVSGSASGVVVSDDGYILTVAHAFFRQGQRFRVVFPDGREAEAKSLGRDAGGDFGLLKITEDGPWPAAAIGESSKIIENQLCFMVGHPGGISSNRQPIVRVGSVLGHTDDWVQSSCVIMPGDSGGPLFDMQGNVIGINSWIGPRLNQNYSVPVDKVVTHWQRLADGEDWGEANWRRGAKGDVPGWFNSRRGRRWGGNGDGDERAAQDRQADRAERSDVLAARLRVAAFDAMSGAIEGQRSSIVTIDSRRNGASATILGVIVDSDGHILTKASEVGSTPICTLADGRESEIQLIAVDGQTDLALYRATDALQDLNHVEWADEEDWRPGGLLASLGPDGDLLGLGVVGAMPAAVRRSTGGYLGVQLDRRADVRGALIDEVLKYGAAEAVGLRDNDIIVEVEGEEIRSSVELIRALGERNAGDVVRLTVLRSRSADRDAGRDASSELSFMVRLGGRPLGTGQRVGHVADQIDVSGRRGSFPLAVRHDTLLEPSQCGATVFDTRGRAVGINIARVDRPGSLALPAGVVRKALARMRAQAAASGEPTEAIGAGAGQ